MLGDLNSPASVGDVFALGDQLLSVFELSDDLFSCVENAVHGEVPGALCPDEDSHSPCNDCQGPSHEEAYRYSHRNGGQLMPLLCTLALSLLRCHSLRSIRAGLMAVAHDIIRMLGWTGISTTATE